MNRKILLADIKRIYREPVLIIFMIVPFLALIAMKCAVVFGFPLLKSQLGWEAAPYIPYILAFSFLLTPAMLGTVAGFMMIDDRDENLFDLFSITPIGAIGYITNRLVIPFVLTCLYTVAGYFIFGMVTLSVVQLTFIALLAGMEAIFSALFLFRVADNKVKGLTITKGMSSLLLVVLADLLNLPWVSFLAAFVPYYWVGQFVLYPVTIPSVLIAIAVHAAWIFVLIRSGRK